jgi:hypothetical protein
MNRGILLAVGVLAVALASGEYAVASAPRLVTLIKSGPAEPDVPVNWNLGGPRHHSAILSFNQGARGPWRVWIRYKGCPVTSLGSLRFTLYTFPRRGATQIQDFRHSRQYSHTVVEHSKSGNATYVFPGKEGTDYFIRVVIPAKAGCASWRMGSLGA